MIEHAWFVCNSPKADSGTFWIDLVDLQQGTLASSLISRQCFLNSIDCLIKGAKVHTGSPQCQQCWKWGHPSDACRCPAVRCPICVGPHHRDSHRSMSGLPSILPTPVDMACPHVCSCINCGAQHAADNRCCPYWCHHFNYNWIKLRSTQDATARKLS
ncbi:Gag-like protein [Macrolepiota fuliginosa MF-IS2]|uniref:Gag-like protein n=1 Tax=Macrolepiota fuliginosa MF-IS2 TaxID=1400762 RepID=A0A9P5WWJ9_9AGAR|nr:Gag-like protein [Macrolepiota fuliginosa MF-IS2]